MYMKIHVHIHCMHVHVDANFLELGIIFVHMLLKVIITKTRTRV